MSQPSLWRRGHRALVVRGAVVVATASLLVSPAATATSLERSNGAGPPGAKQASHQILARTNCPLFPTNNVWNTPITTLPVNPNSAMWLASMSASSTNLHPDYGPSGDPRHPYGIPWTVVRRTTAFAHVSFLYASESDRRAYPLTVSTPIEGGSDRHALMVDPYRSHWSVPCTLFETYATVFHPGGRSTAGSGAIWDLNSNALRSADFTSADAAGLPILPGLVNFDQVAAGAMNHALRFTAQCTQRSYLWPARHQAGQSTTSCPPMGARFRLDASFTLPSAKCSRFCQTVIATMKTYGLILADNGSNWYLQGTGDIRWTSSQVDELKQIPANQFVAVDESCLMTNSNSGAALQPGSPAYIAACGS